MSEVLTFGISHMLCRRKSRITMLTKYNIKKFNGKNDFHLWKMKMEAIMIQQGADKALVPLNELPSTMTEKEWAKMQTKAYSLIILSLSNLVLRNIAHEKIVLAIWKKLKELYRTKVPPNQIYLKEKFFGLKMDELNPIEDSLDENLDLENFDIKMDEEDKAMILLNSLSKSLRFFKETLKYGGVTISVDEI